MNDPEIRGPGRYVNILRDKQVRKKASFREVIKENKPLRYACNIN